MRIGYACLLVGVEGTTIRTCRLDAATQERMADLVSQNLGTLKRILDYNRANNIHMFRISSDIIPFGSSKAVSFPWQTLYAEELQALGKKANQYDIRLSMHPGQYTVLNSPHAHVVENAIRDLAYHCDFLDAMGMNATNKIILHIGGIYGDKPAAIERFKSHYINLDDRIKQHLVIENDDTCYTIEDVLAIGKALKIPVVFDNLHHEINPSSASQSAQEWIAACAKTWSKKDGVQKIHYSQQAESKREGSHSETIDLPTFLRFYKTLPTTDLDIMLEVKDKNMSAVKCIQAIDGVTS
ncbi:MAG: UV DNA damage repair endonuclease UvsE [bacterium]